MKVSQSIVFSHEVDGRVYHLSFPLPAPFGESYDVAAAVCGEFLKKLKEQQNKVNENVAHENVSSQEAASEQVSPEQASPEVKQEG